MIDNGAMVILLGHRRVDLDARLVSWEGGQDRLTPTEAKLLGYLHDRLGQAVSRDELLEQVWGYAPSVRSRTVDTTVRRLRNKIEDDPITPVHLLTAYGVGYQLAVTEVPDEQPDAPTHAALGPFDLLELLGRGGSGEVWRAVHRRSGGAVAVKLLTERHTRTTSVQRAFQREARAAARLDHPHVVRLLDLGAVDDSAARATGLPEGTPWLAMELGTGSLSRLRGRLAWEELRTVLLHTLDALAHAHARGLVHLDVKPANLVVGCGTSEGRVSGFRLTDFGIARAVTASTRGELGGTPSYMAPEQVRGAWRDIGPATDLFGLGCTAWALATGQPPFRHRGSRKRLARGWEALPELRPTVPVPDGFRDWLGKLLERESHDRFQRAAEAAQALRELGEAGRPAAAAEGEASTAAHTELPTELFTDVALSAVQPEMAPRTRTLSVEALPADQVWWRREPPPTPIQLADAGLALLPLREAMFVGRERARKELWERLLQVRDGQGPQVLEIAGDGGLGVSRLGRWLAERAHELGIAEVVVCGADQGGVREAIRNWLRCDGLDREATHERVRRFLARHGARQRYLPSLVTAALEGRAGRDGPRILARLLEQAASRRTVLLLLDDAHRLDDGLAVVLALLERGPNRVATVLTVAEDQAHAGDAARTLRSLRARPEHLRCALGPLDAAEQAALVRRVITLEAGVEARLLELAGGNPSLLLQQVADWSEREMLVPGDQGFRLGPGAVTSSESGALWLDRVDRVGASEPLELAAALGRRFDRSTWKAVARTDALLPFEAAGLVTESGGQYALASEALRAGLEERARAGGRWKAHHAHCVSRTDRRRGWHLLEAGRAEEAVAHLLASAVEDLEAMRTREAGAHLDLVERALDAAGVDVGDRRRGEAAAVRLRVLDQTASRKELHAAAATLATRARAFDWPVVGVALRVAGRALLGHSDASLGEASLREAVSWCEDHGDLEEGVRALASLASHLAYRGQPQAGVDEARTAVARADALGEDEARVSARLALSLALQLARQPCLEPAREAVELADASGRTLWWLNATERLMDAQMGTGDDATDTAHRLLGVSRERGWLRQASHALNALGEMARKRGDRVDAELAYRQVIELSDVSTWSRQGDYSRLNLALLLLGEGSSVEVRELAGPVAERGAAQKHPPIEGAARAVLAAAAAQGQHFDQLQAELTRYRAIDAEVRLADRDLALAWSFAAEACEAHEQRERARACWEEAAAQHLRTGHPDRAHAARERLREL